MESSLISGNTLIIKMPIKSKAKKQLDKKYYILDTAFGITPVADYKFRPNQNHLEALVNSECFFIDPQEVDLEMSRQNAINELGFFWDALAEPGHMRQNSTATTMLEAIDKYVWQVANNFCLVNDMPMHRVSGGELYDSTNYQIARQLSRIAKNLIYGTNQYDVIANGQKQILRYSACTQKLIAAKGAELNAQNLPIGIFELSKSYRFEKEPELQLCKRVRSFRLPELHIINKSLDASLKKALIVHQEISNQINKYDQNCELYCSVTYDFFRDHLNFLKALIRSIGRPMLLAVYNEGVNCGNGIKIDAEYKVFDTSMTPLEIATFQVDDGTSDFSFDVKHRSQGGEFLPVSTIHTVFFSSLERAAYFFIDRALKIEGKTGIRCLPFWLAPTQVRLIVNDGAARDQAKILAKELSLLNIRVDIDDRKYKLTSKLAVDAVKWLPFVVIVEGGQKGGIKLTVQNRLRGSVKQMTANGLKREIKAENKEQIFVPLYSPTYVSRRVI